MKIQLTGLLLLLLSTFAGPSAAAAARETLTAQFLRSEAPLSEPVDLAAFAPAAGARTATTAFGGQLSFRVRPGGGHFRLLRDLFDSAAGNDHSYRYPPPFAFTFAQVKDRLVPTQRGAVATDHPWWEWIVEPGRVWREEGDDGWMRAAVPFTLAEKNANCMHNGVLTFVYAQDGEVSRVAWQISQETCRYFQFDAWGVTAARYQPGDVSEAAAIAESYRRERAGRMPVKSVEALRTAHPGIDPQALASAAEVSPEALTTFGLVIEGVHYAGPCSTRQGPYPFCDEMVLPSYSIAKSIHAGLGLMRLELLLPGAMQERIADYVPQCARAGWDDVTFAHALDMATGRYHSLVNQSDEDATTATTPFFTVTRHAQKIRIACMHYPRRAPPGTQWSYHTTDTYVLGTAVHEYWRRKRGAQADFYTDVLIPVWRQLGMSRVIETPRRTADAVRQPFTGWGLMLLRDDFARFGTFMARDRGTVNGTALVAPREMRAALQLEATDRGFPAPDEHFRYNNGLWAWNAREALGCPGDTWVAFMSGYGGVSVVLLPNGEVYYYVSDNDEFRWARAIAQVNLARPFCAS